MCFVWISEQTAIISLCSINLSAFITQAESVFCAVRNGSLRGKSDRYTSILKRLKLRSEACQIVSASM